MRIAIQVNYLFATPLRLGLKNPFTWYLEVSSEESIRMVGSFSPNDWVVYTRQKHSISPGKRAKHIWPSPHGEMYSYKVEKYWIVREVKDGLLVVETRRGKQHTLPITDSRVRKANLWERLFLAGRFPCKSRASPPDFANGTPTVSR